jgi:hypothetical protein
MRNKFNVSPVVPPIRTLGSEEGNARPAARLNLISTLGPRRVLHSINCQSPGTAHIASDSAAYESYQAPNRRNGPPFRSSATPSGPRGNEDVSCDGILRRGADNAGGESVLVVAGEEVSELVVHHVRAVALAKGATPRWSGWEPIPDLLDLPATIVLRRSERSSPRANKGS